MTACTHCDGECGSAATYAGQACIPLNGRVVCIDWCIHHIVAALNAGGVRTFASCCGHGKQDGSILLEDGRELVIRQNCELDPAQPSRKGESTSPVTTVSTS